MTLSPPPQRLPAASRDRGIGAGLAALVLLAVVAVMPPLALLAFVGNPAPEQAVLAGQLTDDAIIGMLAAVVWLAWAQLVLAILVEAVAAVRGVGLPGRIPLCGPQQHLARRLVLAVAFLLAGTATVTGSYAGTSASATPIVAEECAPSLLNAAVLGEAPRQISSIHLRDGGDTREQAKPGSPSARDGESAEQTLDKAGARDAGIWYTVQPPHGRNHDTLWDIAERHLGDGLRWKEIFQLNRDRPQDDGERLEVGRLIYPGWRLLLPADATGLTPAADDHRAAPPDASPRDEKRVDSKAESTAKSAAAEDVALTARTDGRSQPPATMRDGSVPIPRSPAGSTPALSDASLAVSPRPVGPAATEPHAPTSGTEAGRSDQSDATDARDAEPAVPFGALTLGLSALAAAGLTAELARRRRRAQRFRAPSARLRRPAPAEDQAERQLRTANAEITATVLRDALRHLAAACFDAARPLPEVHGVLLNATTITLLLGSDEPDAVSPFATTGPGTWTLAEPSAPLTGDDLENAVDPYPALVSIGVADDAVVLINLEAAGTLHIDGPAEEASAIAQALAAELGTSVLSATAELVLTGCPSEVARLTDPGRTRSLPPDAAARWATGRLHAIGTALTDGGQRDLADARARRLASDLWAPAVLVEIAAAEPPRAPIQGVPFGGVSVVTTAPRDQSDAWSLTRGDGRWRLEPLGLDLDPQRLPSSALESLTGLLDLGPTGEASALSSTLPAAPNPDTDSASPVRMTVTPSASAAGWSPTDLAAIGAAIPRTTGSSARPPTPDEVAAGLAPRVLVLGPVEVTGTIDEGAPNRRRRAVELISYLALHPNASQHQIDEALWPGHRVSANTRNPLVSRARGWLGSTDDGQPHLAHVSDGGRYNLHPSVSCDWHAFCALSRRGIAGGSDGIDDLVAALELVRGRPFVGVNPATYVWAEADTQDMISAIVDVAHALAELSRAVGDLRRGRWAAAKGLAAEPCSEVLLQDALGAARAAGDVDAVERLVAQARRELGELDPDDDLGFGDAVLPEAVNAPG